MASDLRTVVSALRIAGDVERIADYASNVAKRAIALAQMAPVRPVFQVPRMGTVARDMVRWRDWVIDAFNRNLPYDRFTVEQLAGDLLPNATLDQRIASGFNRNHRTTGEGGIIPEEYRVEYVADRAQTTATVWLAVAKEKETVAITRG